MNILCKQYSVADRNTETLLFFTLCDVYVMPPSITLAYFK